MRLAYADPPYLGCCGRYGHRHERPYGCWDEPTTHADLLTDLKKYDGWAYSLSTVSLRAVLPFAPDDVRIGAWVKPWCSFKANDPGYAWEPVLFRSSRNKNERGRDRPTTRDWHAEQSRRRMKQSFFFGAKPDGFCRWVLDLIGYRDGDEFDDFFPGSGIMGRVVAQGVLL